MLEHVAIWTRNLEEMKEFYYAYFNGQAGEKYQSTSDFNAFFESYFLSLGGRENGYEALGLTHLAFSVDTEEEVDALARRAQEESRTVILAPHHTGDGYYEACILDPDGNRVEITVVP